MFYDGIYDTNEATNVKLRVSLCTPLLFENMLRRLGFGLHNSRMIKNELVDTYQAILFSSAFLVKPQGSNSGNSRSLPTRSLEAPSSFMERLDYNNEEIPIRNSLFFRARYVPECSCYTTTRLAMSIRPSV